MKKSQYSEYKIVKILNEAEAGSTVIDVCRQYGISPSTFYRWKAKYRDMEASDIRRLKELEEEDRLKQMYAELSLDHAVLKDLLDVKKGARPSVRQWQKGGCGARTERTSSLSADSSAAQQLSVSGQSQG